MVSVGRRDLDSGRWKVRGEALMQEPEAGLIPPDAGRGGCCGGAYHPRKEHDTLTGQKKKRGTDRCWF